MLSVASATYFAKVCAVPKMVSSDFGKLEVRRHLISGATLRDRRRRNQRRRAGQGAAFEERTAFHDVLTPLDLQVRLARGQRAFRAHLTLIITNFEACVEAHNLTVPHQEQIVASEHARQTA